MGVFGKPVYRNSFFFVLRTALLQPKNFRHPTSFALLGLGLGLRLGPLNIKGTGAGSQGVGEGGMGPMACVKFLLESPAKFNILRFVIGQESHTLPHSPLNP